MSIHFISGKPGGGKTLYSLKLIIEELVHGNRTIVTNVPLKLGELNAYLQKEYPDKSIDLFERVRLLTDDETGRFWTIRGHYDPQITVLTKQEWEEKKQPDYSNVKDSGVFYAIDEIHIKFNARAWMETGRDVLYYLSQHRKLGDTVLAITQAIMNVDKQFRSVTQDYTYLRNLSKEKMGLFRMPAYFIRKTYGSPATDTTQPMETGTFKLNVSGMAACYDTSVGVGIHGRAGADVGERKKGLHWMVFVVGIPVIVLLIVYTVPKAGAWMFSPDKKVNQILSQNTNTVKQIQNETLPKNVAPLATVLLPQVPLLASKTTNCPPDQVGITAKDRLTNRWRVTLSTGETYVEGDSHLTRVSETDVEIDGIRYREYRRPTGQLAQNQSYNVVTPPVRENKIGPYRPVKIHWQDTIAPQ